MRTDKARFRWNLLNALFFFPAVMPAIVKGNAAYTNAVRHSQRAWVRQKWLEAVCVWGVKAVLLWLDWRKALAVVVIPHAFAVWGITSINFLQHDGCDAASPHNHSRNFVGRAFNWFFLNNGFHGIHHQHPGLHWSLAPQAHARELKPFIDSRLDEPSFVKYLFRTFVWPGLRTQFDGTPVKLPLHKRRDEQWLVVSQVQSEKVALSGGECDNVSLS
jgi:hypothetical protein